MGGRAFWNFQRQGMVKMLMPPVVGYGYFLESPIFFYFENGHRIIDITHKKLLFYKQL